MRNSFVALALGVLTVTSTAFAGNEAACPAISGTYNCSALGGIVRFAIPVSQADDKGITVYTIDGAPVIADGAFHKAATLPKIMARYVEDVTYKALCNGTSLTFSGDGKGVGTGEPGKVEGTLTKQSETALQINLVITSPKGTQNVAASCTK